MNKKEDIRAYKEYNEKLNAYRLLLNTTYFDKETIAPKGGNDVRNKALAFMSGEEFALSTDKKYVDLILRLNKTNLSPDLKRDVELAKKTLDSIINFSKEDVMEWELACMDSFDAWKKAKHENDYKAFEPHLIKLIELSKKRAKIRNDKVDPYDLYLDDYEEGMNKKKYDKFFSLIKKELIPFIQKVNDHQDRVEDSFLYLYYPREKQEKFMKEVLLKYLGFDEAWGYMGVSEHPFTNGISGNDVRITTTYNEHNITSCLFSIIHEVGHAYYEHQVSNKYEGTYIKSLISSGMHESQSRFFENYLGRRKSFWKTMYPKLVAYFPENLKDVSLDDFIKAINVSRPSLIRTDADELTYPIHILIRYEIEKGIFDGSISTEHLNLTWRKMYKDYLGIEVPNDTDGILQDVHWAGASFGYFPTYGLGSAIGAQLLFKMERDLDIDGLLEKNKLSTITNYLKKNIQQYGALYNYEKLLEEATGEKFNPKYYIEYLKKKYRALYQI